jgi:hypothetical protein
MISPTRALSSPLAPTPPANTGGGFSFDTSGSFGIDG